MVEGLETIKRFPKYSNSELWSIETILILVDRIMEMRYSAVEELPKGF